MAVKVFLVFLVAFVIFQLTLSMTVKRDAPAQESGAKNPVDDAFEKMKKGFEDFVKDVQTSPLFQNISSAADQLGKTIQEQGKNLVQKIQGSGQPSN